MITWLTSCLEEDRAFMWCPNHGGRTWRLSPIARPSSAERQPVTRTARRENRRPASVRYGNGRFGFYRDHAGGSLHRTPGRIGADEHAYSQCERCASATLARRRAASGGVCRRERRNRRRSLELVVRTGRGRRASRENAAAGRGNRIPDGLVATTERRCRHFPRRLPSSFARSATLDERPRMRWAATVARSSVMGRPVRSRNPPRRTGPLRRR